MSTAAPCIKEEAAGPPAALARPHRKTARNGALQSDQGAS